MTIETLASAALAGLLLAAAPLQPGAPLSRELAAGEAHAFRAELPAGRPFRVRVEQRGIDVAVEAAGPDGSAQQRGHRLPAGEYRLSVQGIAPDGKATPLGSHPFRVVGARW